MGCLAASLGAAVDKGLHFRNATVHTIVRSGGFSHRGVALAALFAASWAALLTSVSALLVATFAPVAGGSGVSLVSFVFFPPRVHRLRARARSPEKKI